MELERGRNYQHYKNKKIYILLDFIYIQTNDIWEDGILYMLDADLEESDYRKFVTTKKEFIEKFTICEEE